MKELNRRFNILHTIVGAFAVWALIYLAQSGYYFGQWLKEVFGQ